MPTIPASQLVSAIPSVLQVGGTGFELIGLLLSNEARVPIGEVKSFADADDVANYFGLASTEADLADKYFNGFTGRTKIPGALLVAQFNEEDAAAFLRSADVSALSLSELQALNGSMTVVVDGYSRTAAVDLAAATSFSSAAGIIETALNGAITQSADFTASITGTTMTVTAVASGTLGVGQTVLGGTVTAGTYIVSQTSGTTGGTGDYEVSVSQTEGSGSLTSQPTDVAVTYDSVLGAFTITSGVVGAISTIDFASGTFSSLASFTEALGAVTSQGAAAAVPGTFMDAVVAENRAWATFFTAFDPDSSGNANKLAFSDWTNDQQNSYAYICWDTDMVPTTQNPASSSLGALIETAQNSGTCLLWSADAKRAAFISGTAASIDFSAKNGRTTFAYRKQSGLTAEVTSLSVAANLLANGYNYYGVWGARADDFINFQDGHVSGDFAWLDSYLDQIWLNNLIQVALLNLLTNTKSIAFNTAGNGLIENSLQDSIEDALNFGAFGPGNISDTQVAQINTAAGINIADTLQAQGYYVQVVTPTDAIRAARGPITVNFWYLDRGSVQKITVNSVAVQ